MNSPNLSTGKLCVMRAIVGEPEFPAARKLRCVYCGWVSHKTRSHETRFFRECKSPQEEPLSTDDLPWLATRIARYVANAIAHAAAGNPTCTGPEIEERFRACSTCPRYNAKYGLCGECGCFVNLRLATEGDNKLAWANERCPLPEPKWLPINRKES